MLLSLKTTNVSGKTRARGQEYFRRGAVSIEDATPNSVYAIVAGGRNYVVNLHVGDDCVVGWCTCPFFRDNELICKHIWATTLSVNAEDLLQLPPAVKELVPGELPEELLDEEWLDEVDDVDDVEENSGELPSFSPPKRTKTTQPPAKKRGPGWKRRLDELQRGTAGYSYHRPWPEGREILYIIDKSASQAAGVLVTEVSYRERKRDGDWSKPKAQNIERGQIAGMTDANDRAILSIMVGPGQEYYFHDTGLRRCKLNNELVDILLPRMCATGRCFFRPSTDNGDVYLLRWSDSCWEFVVDIRKAGKLYEVAGVLRRGSETRALGSAALLVQRACIVDDHLALLDDHGAHSWLRLFRESEGLEVPVSQGDELLKKLFSLPTLPRLQLPEELQVETVAVTPRPQLKISPQKQHWSAAPILQAQLTFDYQGTLFQEGAEGEALYQWKLRQLVRRDRQAERAAAECLHQLGLKRSAFSHYESQHWQLAPRNLAKVVRSLLAEGWHVEAEGKLYRKPGNFDIEVRSGIDWFELHANVQFGEQTANLPALLAALKRGDNTVLLGDGTFGILPEEWLKKYGVLAGLGSNQRDHLRFSRSQVGLLDALLATQSHVSCDEVFQHAREELKRFAGIEPAETPAGFVGELRGYQREGLGWLEFLQRFGFGGCLADDMGLGKTIQVLAMLEKHRQQRASRSKNGTGENGIGAALVVVPRSLVFNWTQEAARFTPQLRVLDHTGAGRLQPGEHFEDYDIILTTYGTLRRDALNFRDLVFDFVILDESQAIKNPNSESAKAARLLQGRHRLAMSGTPVENHLGELWSLFEFLNPGMLGAASVFRLGGGVARNPDDETRQLLAMALRPFILRRTKEQVANDLPEKLEQTLYCDLDAAQRRYYDELRAHYRATLLNLIDRDGMNKVKMHVLEALLRLRQAACHPGLIDTKLKSQPSAKLELLLDQIESVTKEGHKALVFSQFTSLLAIVRERLDAHKVAYEYLDGRTRNRAEKVKRFQEDPHCRLFLISLKAGGVGLNLTAADYVFLLDPWWNPAVEAQAIDRTHRIGQTRRVFAYRLIARDTVEEKVLQLQASKRNLADAIINADNSLVRDLAREDIELLLS